MSREELLIKMKKRSRLDWNLLFLLLPVCPLVLMELMIESKFVDVEKARKDMESFAAINEQKLYRLYKICVDVHSDLESLVKSRVTFSIQLLGQPADIQHELRRRLEQHQPDILDTFTTILDVGSWNIINQSSIPPLIAALQKTQKGPQGEMITQAAREWLRLIAKEGALMFKSHIPILVKEMDNKKVILSEAALQGLAAVVKADKESCPTES
jgi:sister-chromatid-cohesion protein PDS5